MNVTESAANVTTSLRAAGAAGAAGITGVVGVVAGSFRPVAGSVCVMAGLDPAIHTPAIGSPPAACATVEGQMAGSSPAMTRTTAATPATRGTPATRRTETRVAVLYGGISAEREVSLSSGMQVIAALRDAGFSVQPIEVGADLAAVITALQSQARTWCSTHCTAASARTA